MSLSLNLYYIDWEEFHQRFSVDLAEADKEGEIFGNSFWGESSYEGEEFYWCIDVMFLGRIYSNLKAASIFKPAEVKNLNWIGKLWLQLFPLPRPDTKSIATTLQEGTSEFEFYRHWMEDFEFAFSRLIPEQFNKSGAYRDSHLDLSPLEGDVTISTLSPETVRTVYARFPSSEIVKYPTCKAIINTPEYPSEVHCADHYYFAQFIERFEGIVRKAVDENKGLCSFVV